jgi:hypothetical protein
MLTDWHCSRVVIGIEKPGALGDLARVGIRIVRDMDEKLAVDGQVKHCQITDAFAELQMNTNGPDVFQLQ